MSSTTAQARRHRATLKEAHMATLTTAAQPHTTTAIVAVPASGPGALAGYEARCSCGLTMRSSLRVSLELDVRQHDRYHEAQAR